MNEVYKEQPYLSEIIAFTAQMAVLHHKESLQQTLHLRHDR